jgi:GDP-4-dehydro-6-deoxy-D-mannose reductase
VDAKRVVVTGGAGFAGRHLVELLTREGREVIAPTRADVDLRDAAGARDLIASARPESVFHLAAFSSPADSFERPAEALLGNVEMALNVLEAVRHEAEAATVVLVGSGQVYGFPEELPASEDSPLDPQSPYAVSKAGADLLGRQYERSFGLRVARMRPFNHAGPGQAEPYVVSTLARQVAEAEIAGLGECVLRTGNPEAARDFTDVRDVVRAYALAADGGSGAFNVCSGVATPVARLVEMAAACTRLPVRHEVDASRLRENDGAALYGSAERLAEATGWRPEVPLEQMVADACDWWRARLAG